MTTTGFIRFTELAKSKGEISLQQFSTTQNLIFHRKRFDLDNMVIDAENAIAYVSEIGNSLVFAVDIGDISNVVIHDPDKGDLTSWLVYP